MAWLKNHDKLMSARIPRIRGPSRLTLRAEGSEGMVIKGLTPVAADSPVGTLDIRGRSGYLDTMVSVSDSVAVADG